MKSFNKLFFLTFIFVFTFSITANAQNNDESQGEDKEHSLYDGSRALQFRVSENFRLSSFRGSVFSYKWHRSAKKAYRVGLSTSSVLGDQNYEDMNNSDQVDNTTFTISANFAWVNYLNPENDIKFFYGVGPVLSYRYQFIENTTAIQTTSDKVREYGLAALGFGGVEWFFHPSMSLHAEYGLNFRVDIRDYTRRRSLSGETETQRADQENVSYQLVGQGVSLGLSVYF